MQIFPKSVDKNITVIFCAGHSHFFLYLENKKLEKVKTKLALNISCVKIQ